ncbi:hypothetical protein RSPO_m01202 (plasmid) [Ralstonia solanacearum Po82]|uniref:Uncharacterized protein n=1 Tax=Ralstonia solanacearum (strain Po82) TaxID=1031711 RepID=F6GBA8_RALS8|nr:hypothetical protein RSPO_m01202 [Ralstonia solanacearum Po82]
MVFAMGPLCIELRRLHLHPLIRMTNIEHSHARFPSFK